MKDATYVARVVRRRRTNDRILLDPAVPFQTTMLCIKQAQESWEVNARKPVYEADLLFTECAAVTR